jgi:chaperonin GroES
MNVDTLQDRVLVRHTTPETVSSFGIVISQGIDKSYEAVVLGVGPGKKSKTGVVIPPDVKVNDRILFNGTSGVKVKLQGENLLILKEEEILAVIED